MVVHAYSELFTFCTCMLCITVCHTVYVQCILHSRRWYYNTTALLNSGVGASQAIAGLAGVPQRLHSLELVTAIDWQFVIQYICMRMYGH